MFSLKEIISEISNESGTSEGDVKKKIEEKQIELSGLVSPEGAAYIVGKELGVNLLKDPVKRVLKINNIVPGIRSADVIGRVVNISEKRDFEKNGKPGSVVNVTIGDETGITRISLWNDDVKLVDELGMKEGDAVKITGGYVKEDGRGGSEIRLGRTGKLEMSDVNVPEVEIVKKVYSSPEAKNISDLREGEYIELRASLVQLFRRYPFYEVCPTCGSRLEKDGDGWKCRDHGNMEPKYNMVLSGVMDDGSGNVRVVFFRDLAEKVAGKETEELRKLVSADTSSDKTAIYDDMELGKEFIVRGMVKKNSFTERIELVANEVEKLNIKKETENMIGKIDGIKD